MVVGRQYHADYGRNFDEAKASRSFDLFDRAFGAGNPCAPERS